MFKYHKKITKEQIHTTYGSICIENIVFDPCEIENALPEIVLQDDNLKHMFAENDLDIFKRRNIYKRFIPSIDYKEIQIKQIEQLIKDNKSFYSFLAEGILGLIYRDIYNYKLAKCTIDVRETPFDSHTGVDSCMYDNENQIIILGEAKFYENLNEGINAIINDFTKKNIKNKLDSMKRAAENNPDTFQILVRNLGDGVYKDFTLKQFMQQKLIFSGFVLHSESNIKKYCSNDIYDKYRFSDELLRDHISKNLNIKTLKSDYNIIFVHLPINQKKSLICKIISESKKKLNNM